VYDLAYTDISLLIASIMHLFFKILISAIFTLLIFAVVVTVAALYWSRPIETLSDAQTLAVSRLKNLGYSLSGADVIKVAKNGDIDALELLDLAKVDIHAVDTSGKSALRVAIENNQWRMADILNQLGLDINQPDSSGMPPLAAIIQSKQFHAADQLIASGAKVDFRVAGNKPALINYLQTNDEPAFRYLLEKGANPNSVNNNGKTVLEYAIESGKLDLATLLITKGAKVSTSRSSDENLLLRLLQEYPDYGISESQLLPFIDVLIKAGIDIEEESPLSGARPVQVAIYRDEANILSKLLEHTSNLKQCFWPALKLQETNILKLLLKHGASIEEPGANGDSPLADMVKKGKTDMIQFLLDNGANPNQITKEGQPLIFTALAVKKTDSSLALLSHKRHPDVNQLMRSPVSAEFRKLYGAKGLVDWYCLHDSKLTPLIFAVLQNKLKVAEKLLSMGAKRHQHSKRGAYPLHIAAAYHNVKMQQLLLGVPYQDKLQKRYFVIDLSDQKVRFYKEGKLIKSARCSTGKRGYRTPPGQYVITDKQRHKVSNIYKGAKMPFFQRLSCKDIGFHQGYTGSRYASHGCIRLPYSAAKFFFAHSKVGDRVTIRK